MRLKLCEDVTRAKSQRKKKAERHLKRALFRMSPAHLAVIAAGEEGFRNPAGNGPNTCYSVQGVRPKSAAAGRAFAAASARHSICKIC